MIIPDNAVPLCHKGQHPGPVAQSVGSVIRPGVHPQPGFILHAKSTGKPLTSSQSLLGKVWLG